VLRSMVKEDLRRNTKKSFRRSPLLSKIGLAVDGVFARPLPPRPFSSKIDVTIDREKC